MNTQLEKILKVFKENYREIPLTEVFDTPYHALVSVMLSARTRDETTVKVCRELFSFAPTPDKIWKMENVKLENILRRIGFYKTKTKNLQALTEKLIKEFSGEIPQTLEELTSLPGVGRKTANIILARCFNIPAIGVDTHVHRVSNMLGLVNTKTPEKTEIELMKVLPKNCWVDVNHLFVSIGQQYRSEEQLRKFLQENYLII